VVVHLNREAITKLPLETLWRLEIIPGGTHLFEELGALDGVSDLALDWFKTHLKAGLPRRDVPLPGKQPESPTL